MASSPPKPQLVVIDRRIGGSTFPLFDNVWQAPLVPAALAVTAGIVADRYASIPLLVSLVTVLIGLAAWMASRNGRQRGLALIYLGVAAAALGAAYHHWQREIFPADNIGLFATDEARPARLRGIIAEEPTIVRQPSHDPLRSFPLSDSTTAVLSVTELRQRDDWLPVSGRARLVVSGHLEGMHVGDEIEVAGRLTSPSSPANPGEFDYPSFLLDQRIRAVVSVRKTIDAVVLRAAGWPHSLTGCLAVLRGWGQRSLQETVPEDQSGVAMALLLGEGSTMTNADWEKYIKTGVIHVLAISGQHLVILAAFLWLTLRLFGVRRRRGALGVALFLLGYALLAGGRPPVLRSAIQVCACCGAILLRRPMLSANGFALSWLVVVGLNPTDIFNAGCQLSFLAVATLYWGVSRWLRPSPDALERLIDESRPTWERLLRKLMRSIGLSYAVTLIIWLAAAPLVAARYHLISPVGLLIGPPVVLLTSVALLSGFLLLFAAAIGGPLVSLFASITGISLAGCEFLVNASQQMPAGHWYVSDIPGWWLWAFYLAYLAFLMFGSLQHRWRWIASGGLAWLCVGLVAGWSRPAPEELRCTFLAVGHGGCTVLETPDGRVLLYDAGSMGGPDVTRRQIAPFLWHRGIRRIDEIFLSHADLDHFNGLLDLLERFAVGQVTRTPSFSDKKNEAVQVTLDALEQRRIPVRVAWAGDRISTGALTIEVLHPPPDGPKGNENARSMVLLVRHAGHTILLTGDLEGPGLARFLNLPATDIDVFMAPHHGSRVSNLPALAAWAKPKVVISCEGPPRWPKRFVEPYTPLGAQVFPTWPHGAVTIRSSNEALSVETFKTGQGLLIQKVPPAGADPAVTAARE